MRVRYFRTDCTELTDSPMGAANSLGDVGPLRTTGTAAYAGIAIVTGDKDP